MRAVLAEIIADRLPLDQVDPGLVERFLDEAAKNDPAYIGRFELLIASYDWSDQLSRIRCPTLVVVPGGEPIGSTANYEPFRHHIKDVEIL
jgi:3-oxoadipate enol-lactonase